MHASAKTATIVRLVLGALFCVASLPISFALDFTPGNIVVYRVGTGTGSLVNTGNPVFLDEYTPAGALVQSIALPTAATLPQHAVIASGTATSEGFLARSADGRYLVVTGYASTYTSSLANTAGTVVNRVIGRVDAGGTIDTTTALTDFASGNNPRSATSNDGTQFWAVGGAGGVRYALLGGTTSVDLTTGSPNGNYANVRTALVAGGQLYTGSGSGTNTFKGVSAIGTGLPTTPAQPVVRLAGLTDTLCPSTDAFVFLDLSAEAPGLDTLYIADDTNTTAGGIQKYSFVAGSWVSNGAIEGPSQAYRGLAGTANGSSVTLYATRKGGSGAAGGGELVVLVDTSGYNAAINATSTVLATAAANTAFRGVAFAPERCASVVCTALDTCHDVGVCDPSTGACSNPPKADGTTCDDGAACTTNDVCAQGTCSGTPGEPPVEVNDSLVLFGGINARLVWSDDPGPYNVYRGALTATWTYDETPFATGVAAPPVPDDTLPTAGGTYWYLVSRVNACGESIKGRDSAGNPIP